MILYFIIEILQFKSEQNPTKQDKKEENQEKTGSIVADRNQYNFDGGAIKEEDNVPGVKDYGFVFR